MTAQPYIFTPPTLNAFPHPETYPDVKAEKYCFPYTSEDVKFNKNL